jgi:hypothetical protein
MHLQILPYKVVYSTVDIATAYGRDDLGIEVRFPASGNICLVSAESRPALGPTQPSIQLVPGAFFPGGKSGRDVKLTTHLHLVPRLQIRVAVSPLLHMSIWHSAYLINHRDTTLPFFFTFLSCVSKYVRRNTARMLFAVYNVRQTRSDGPSEYPYCCSGGS